MLEAVRFGTHESNRTGDLQNNIFMETEIPVARVGKGVYCAYMLMVSIVDLLTVCAASPN